MIFMEVLDINKTRILINIKEIIFVKEANNKTVFRLSDGEEVECNKEDIEKFIDFIKRIKWKIIKENV